MGDKGFIGRSPLTMGTSIIQARSHIHPVNYLSKNGLLAACLIMLPVTSLGSVY